MQMQTKTEWMKLVDDERRVEAINFVRAKFCLDMRTAKDIVDEYHDEVMKHTAVNNAFKIISALSDEQREIVFSAFGVSYQASA